MNRDFSHERLAQVLGNVTPAAANEPPAPDTKLFDKGLLDSLTLIQFVMALEEEFKFRFDYDDVQLDHFQDLASLRGVLNKKYGAR